MNIISKIIRTVLRLFLWLLYICGNVVIWWSFFFWSLSIIVLAWRWFFAYDQHFLSDAQLTKNFSQNFERVEIWTFSYSWKTIHYVDVWDIKDTPVLLLHGAPWSINDRKPLLKISSMHKGYRFIIPDRIGYWKSSWWISEPDINKHAQAYAALFEKLIAPTWQLGIVLGHSYGWPIALSVQIHNPHLIQWSIIVAWAVDPGQEVIFPVSYLVQYQPLYWMIWPPLRVANDEKLWHVASLKKSMVWLDTIQTPVVIVHGTEDILVPYANIWFMLEHIDSWVVKLISLSWQDHPLQYKNPQAIADALTQNFPQKQDGLAK